MIKYIGSKRVILPKILEVTGRLPKLKSVADVFSGTSRVGYAFKDQGFQVTSNDYCKFAHTLAQCYVQSNKEDWQTPAESLIQELNRVKGSYGYFTQTFCENSRFIQPINGERVDAIRNEIENKSLHPELKAIVLTSLMEAADRVDSTCGIQMAYLKKWAKRSYKPLELRMPKLLSGSISGKCKAYNLDANALLEQVGINPDITYLDPPYNNHSYLSNYHIWETLVRWDSPEPYGVAQKRIDCKTVKSPFNSKRLCVDAMRGLLSNVSSKLIILSFNNEGFFTKEDLEDMLRPLGKVFTVAVDYKRYVGAQIGQHNLEGKRVSEPTNLRNLEFLFYVSKDSETISALERILSAPNHR